MDLSHDPARFPLPDPIRQADRLSGEHQRTENPLSAPSLA